MIFIQRDGLTGSYQFSQDAARILDSDGNVVIDWTTGGLIENIPQGDGYTLETRVGDVVAQEALAVGVVVFAIGQSNMDGWFRDTDFTSPFSTPVYDLTGNPYRTLGAGATWFAKNLSDTLDGVPIGFVNGSVGGSSLLLENYRSNGMWLSQEAGNIYDKALDALDAAGGKAEFTLWIQGESDANTGTTTYQAYYDGFQTLIDRIEADVSGTTVIVGGLASFATATEESLQAIRDAQFDVAATRENVVYVATDLDSSLVDGSHISNIESAWQAVAMSDAALSSLSIDITSTQQRGTNDADLFLGSSGHDIYAGMGGNDEIYGGAGADLLLGRSGDDIIHGDDGDDAIAGGDGDDILDGDNGNDLILGDAGKDHLQGGAGDDLLKGGDDEDYLEGGSGQDTLNGEAGADTLIGGAGDDIYIVSDSLDTIIEDENGGHELIKATASVTMSANVEDLTFVQTSVRMILTGIGNDANNKMTGTHTSNYVFHGMGGDDTLIGSYASDTLFGDDGNDILDGASGADDMHGGRGDDVFYVDVATDRVIEAAGEGTDWIYSKVEYKLPENVENLSFSGTYARNGTGNDLDNIMIAGRGNNTLFGLGGNDQLYGDAWADTLDGGTGADKMTGGSGYDTYIVDDIGDQTIELAGGGTDLVKAGLSWTLTANVENLTLTGTSAINATGNELANAITGNDADNLLTGLGGNDTLTGGAGIDRAVYSGKFAAYTINRTNASVKSTTEGTDKLSGIEILQFSDGVYIWETGIFKTANATPTLTFQPQSANIVESGYSSTGVPDATILATKADPDSSDITRFDTSGWIDNGGLLQKIGTYGVATLDAMSGLVSYALDNARAATQALAEGQTTTDTFSLTVRDLEGAAVTQTLSFTIRGADDTAPPIYMKGTSGADQLSGNTGNDWLDGGAGADTFFGSDGNDGYVFDNAGDRVIGEIAGGGTDTIWTTVSVDLRSQGATENLRLYDAGGAINGTGNATANTITGNASVNVIAAGLGNDKLYGKGGADLFVFGEAGAENMDSIWDFDADDKIQLSKSVFSGLSYDEAGVLSAVSFAVGKATGANAQVVYDKNSGILSYDANGSTADGMSEIAYIGKNITSFFNNADIVIV